MSKRIRNSLFLASSAAVLVLGGPVTAASAAHCTDEGPGHSYFGTEHVKEANHNEGTHRGFSSCNPDGKANGNDRTR